MLLIILDFACLGLREEGLFRRSPQSSMLRAAQDAYDRGSYRTHLGTSH